MSLSPEVNRTGRLASGAGARAAVLLILSVAAFVLLWRLGRGSLTNSDESIYAHVAKEVLRRGEWLTLYSEGVPWFHKPPLSVWLTAGFYRLFEANLFWTRAASAFAGVATAVVVYLIGKLIYDRRVGFIAALILLANYEFVCHARQGKMDVMLTLFLSLAVYGYLLVRKGEPKCWYLVGAACGLAVMTKGAAAVLAPALIALELLFDGGFKAAVRGRHFWLGCALALAVAAPWHVAMYAVHGETFLSEYVGYQVLRRSLTAIEGNDKSTLYYLALLLEGFAPWVFLLPFALASAARDGAAGRAQSRILLLMAALVFGLYTAVQTKLNHYLVPIYPALSIMTAALVVRAYESRRPYPFAAMLAGTIGAAAVAPWGAGWTLLGAGALLAVGAAAAKRVHSPCAVVIMTLLMLTVGFKSLRHFYGHSATPISKLAQAARREGGADPLLLLPAAEFNRNVVLFYSERPVQGVDNLDELTGVTRSSKRELIVTRDRMSDVESFYHLRVLAEAEPLVYAEIQPRDSGQR